jgi:hypothetical protein
MRVDIDQSSVAAVKAMLGDLKASYPKVISTAINKTLTTVKTQATARIGNELNLKAARIKEDISLQKANYGKLSGAFISTGKPVGLIQFTARQTAKGVSFKVKRTGARTTLKHAYIGKGKGGGLHVFWRKNRMPGTGKFPVGKKSKAPWQKMPKKFSKPVERLTGPRIEDILAQSKVLEPITIQAGTLYLSNVDNKVDEVLRRHNG